MKLLLVIVGMALGALVVPAIESICWWKFRRVLHKALSDADLHERLRAEKRKRQLRDTRRRRQ